MQQFGTGKDCNLGQVGGLSFTFLDVVAAAMEGAGGVDLELGGVLATTEGIDYGDPFGLVLPGLPTGAPALNRDEALKVLSQLAEALRELRRRDQDGSSPARAAFSRCRKRRQ